jgi:hypothetical protein
MLLRINFCLRSNADKGDGVVKLQYFKRVQKFPKNIHLLLMLLNFDLLCNLNAYSAKLTPCCAGYHTRFRVVTSDAAKVPRALSRKGKSLSPFMTTLTDITIGHSLYSTISH